MAVKMLQGAFLLCVGVVGFLFRRRLSEVPEKNLPLDFERDERVSLRRARFGVGGAIFAVFGLVMLLQAAGIIH